MANSWFGVAACTLVVLSSICVDGVQGIRQESSRGSGGFGPVHTKTFRSQAFTLQPGDVVNNYHRMEMPQGHVALRSLDAQLVDSSGTPIPLSEKYMHHWVMLRYYIKKGSTLGSLDSQLVSASNDGVCQRGPLDQWFGLGSETRGTNTTIPAPYGIVIGDPEKTPYGFEEIWVLNVHTIDTRSTADPVGCTECLCDLYNVTVDEYGREIADSYLGGLFCCYDKTHCALKEEEGLGAEEKEVFLEYEVTWVDMEEGVIPLLVYILDVTDSRAAENQNSKCQIEYTVPKCASNGSECVHTAEAAAFLPEGGHLIYGVGHQHGGGVGIMLSGEDGREICGSYPTYGDGIEAGNESGYIVGMSTCYPTPGSVQIKSGERLRLRSWYNNEQQHTGVMGLFYLLIAETIADPEPQKKKIHWTIILGVVSIVAAISILGVVVFQYFKMRRGRQGYESI